MTTKSKIISSLDNSSFKMFKSLTEAKGLKKENLFLVSGGKLVIEFINKSPDFIESIIVDHKQALEYKKDEYHTAPDQLYVQSLGAPLQSLLNKNPNIEVFLLESALFKQVDILGTHEPILVVKQKPIPIWNATEAFEGLEVLCPLSDPQNLGALARSAWALGANRIILLKESAHPYLPKTWKASSGNIWDIPLYKGPSLHELKQVLGSGNIISLNMKGTTLWEFKWPKTSRLLLGEEGQGIPTDLSTTQISIPMRPGVESLNVSVAGALAINHYSITN